MAAVVNNSSQFITISVDIALRRKYLNQRWKPIGLPDGTSPSELILHLEEVPVKKIAFSVAAAASLTLAACGSQSGGETNTADTNTEATATEAESDTNAAASELNGAEAMNAANNALDSAGNAIENGAESTGNALQNAGNAVENTATNAQ
jgi:predicted small secreted protein